MVRRPLLALSFRGRRIHILPGMGLGLGDQFMLHPVLADLATCHPNARFRLVCEYASFWEQATWNGNYVAADPHDAVAKVIASLDSRDILVAGYYPANLPMLAHSPCTTIFCKGANLASFRAFIQHGGRLREISLETMRTKRGEAAKFRGLFYDFGFNIPHFPEKRPPRDALGDPHGVAVPRRSIPVLVHAHTAKPYKTWPVCRWVALVQALHACHAHVSISAGANSYEHGVAGQVAAACPSAMLLPRQDLRSFLSSLRAYDLTISGDTFLPHALTWLAGPTPKSLTIFGPTDPLRFCPRSSEHAYVAGFHHDPKDIALAGLRLAAESTMTVSPTEVS